MKHTLLVILALMFVPVHASACDGYTVQRGDTLYRIARAHGFAWQDLARANGIANPARLYTGQCLQLTNAHTAARVTAPGVLDYRIVSQPAGDEAWLPEAADEVMVYQPLGVTTLALTAHSHLAGNAFENLYDGALVSVIYADGSPETFELARQFRFQVHDDVFIDLDTDRAFPYWSMSLRFFQGGYDLVLFTCLTIGDDPSGGRLFWAGYRID